MQLDSEQRLELGFDYRSTGTFQVSGNRMPRVAAGVIAAPNYRQKGRWQVGNRKVLRAELDYLQSFWRARLGSVQRFRLKDWGDFATTHNGTQHQGVLGSGTGNGVLTQFQLIKRYQPGGDYQDRIITKPVAGSVSVYVNDTLQASGWSVNTTTGIVTFTTAPANGAVLRAAFEFDVRVSFAGEFNRTFNYYNTPDNDAVYQLPGLAVVERPRHAAIVTTAGQLPIQPDYQSSVSIEPKVSKLGFGDGFVQRIAQGLNNQPEKWQLTWADLETDEAMVLLDFFKGLNAVTALSWQSPYSATAKKYVAESWTAQPTDDDTHDLSASLYQVPEL